MHARVPFARGAMLLIAVAVSGCGRPPGGVGGPAATSDPAPARSQAPAGQGMLVCGPPTPEDEIGPCHYEPDASQWAADEEMIRRFKEQSDWFDDLNR